MNRYALSFLLIILFLFTSLFTKGIDKKTLPARYKKWLEEEVVYIVLPKEREVFLRLEKDRERELFIEAFWKHRDPTDGTPENEFRREHYRRINYANHFFGRGSPLPGWKTDRGRIYILLGEPRTVQRITGKNQVYNSEIWFFGDLTKYGLPPGFHLVFFQKGGSGQYVLYSPARDGPQALLTTYFGPQTDYLVAFSALKRVEPRLAQVSLSLIPGEIIRPGSPSIASEMLLQYVHDVPRKQFEDKYAEKFLMYKDIVELEYSTNYIGNDSLVKIIRGPTGMYFVHYIVEIKEFSLLLFQDKYSTRLEVNGFISDLKGNMIYQFEESIPVELTESQLNIIRDRPFGLYDMFPLLAGKYRLSVLIKNSASKEFTSLEKEIKIPPDESSLGMSSLVLAYREEKTPPGIKRLEAFRLGQFKVYSSPRMIFRPEDNLFLHFQVSGINQGLEQKGIFTYEFFEENEKVLTLTKRVKEYEDRVNFKETFPLQNFPPAHYRIKVSLLNGDQVLVFRDEQFDITPVSVLARPWVYSKKPYSENDPVYFSVLGKQHLNKGEIKKAQAQFERAYSGSPENLNYAFDLARSYFLLKEYNKTKQILQPFADLQEARYEVYFLLGQAHQEGGEFDKAIAVYNKVISSFGININLLNSLGECYFQLGNRKEALTTWEKSLQIDPDQDDIKTKIRELKK